MAASNFTNLYNNGEWGYMGIGPMPAKSFTLTLKADSDHPIFTLGACDSTHIVAYNPNNTSQYAVYSGTSFTVYNNNYSFELASYYISPDGAPDEQTITIDYDPSKWDFHGLESLEGAALCIATNEYGYAPGGSDYASISTERKNMFWYEVNVIVMVDKINSCDIYAKRAECDADGNDLSTTYATKSELPEGVPAVTSSDDSKVLTASYSGGVGSYSWQTAQGGGASYTAGDGIDISAQDAISAKVGNGLEIGNASTTITGTIGADYAYLSASHLYMLYGVADLNATLVNALSAGDVTFLVNKIYTQSSSEALVPIIYQKRYSSSTYIGYNYNNYILFSNQPTIALDANHQTQANFAFTLNAANINSTESTVTWATVQSDPTQYVVGLCKFADNAPVKNYSARYVDDLTGTETRPIPTGTYSYVASVAGRFINVANPLPASAQADANKVLTVNASGNAEWETPATVTVDQTYNAASNNAQSGVAVAQAVAGISVDEVPPVTSYSDDGKVLTASYDLSTGEGSYAWETPKVSLGTWENINLTDTEYGYYYGDSANGLQKDTMYLLHISVVPASNVPSTVLYLRVAINNSNRTPRGQSVDKVVVRVPWDPTSPAYSGAPFTVTTAIHVSYNPSDSSQPEGTGFAVCASTTSSTSPSETYLSSVSVRCLPLGEYLD